MNIVVTGALGTLGRPLVAKLIEQGHKVFEIDLMHNGGSRYFRADISIYRELINALGLIEQWCKKETGEGVHYVYHLAAEFGRINGEIFYDKLWNTNAIGTKNILEAQKGGIFDRLIFASSSEVYGETQAESLSESIMDEVPVVQHNDYAISKWVNEKQIINHQKRTGLPVMRLRLFNAYGPGEYYTPFRSVVCLFCYRALNDIPYQIFEGYHRVFMYVDDLISTMVNCVGMFADGKVVNIGGVEYCSVKEMSNIILETLGKDDNLVQYLPEDKHNTTNKKPDITLAKKILNHNPTITLEEGIPLTLEWMEKVYNIKGIV
jgi:dTDP-glucose 4,6-dehydratase